MEKEKWPSGNHLSGKRPIRENDHPGNVFPGKKPSGKVTIRETTVYRYIKLTTLSFSVHVKLLYHILSIIRSMDWFVDCLQTKKSNRKCEFVLRDVEMMSSLAHILSHGEAGFDYPSAELTRLWKTVLLNQFHDVLPGTSINAVWLLVSLTALFTCQFTVSTRY